jgi:glycogen synthase
MCNAFTYFLRQSEHHMQQSFDIIHCHDWLAAKALVQLKQAGRRCILTMHSTEFGRSGNMHHAPYCFVWFVEKTVLISTYVSTTATFARFHGLVGNCCEKAPGGDGWMGGR